MPDIRMPDGTIIRNVPEGTTKAQLQAKLAAHRQSNMASKGPQSLADNAKPMSSLGTVRNQGAMFGYSDEIGGGIGAIMDAVAAPFSDKVDFNPANSYRKFRDLHRADAALTRKNNPTLAPMAELAGGLMSIPIASGAATARNLPQAIKAGAKVGAKAGALAGFGYGEGLDKSLGGAAGGAILGAGMGAAVPFAVEMAARPIRAVRDFVSPQGNVGRKLVARALADDRVAPRHAANALAESQALGVPTMLADLGDNSRALLASVSRKSPPARTLVRDAVVSRQQGQGERIRGAISRDLGPIANPDDVSAQLMQKAKLDAAPLYESAYAKPAVDSEEITGILQTPAGKKALQKAYSIAANERVDPTKLGVDLNDAGEVVLTRVPSMQTLDYVKRGLDDVLEGYRDKVTNKLVLDDEGRAIVGLRASFVKELDRLNPDYGAARAAYAGPASANAALQKGRGALNASADEIVLMTKGMGPAEKAQFSLGYRAALSDKIDRSVDGADKVGALLGTPRKRNALASVFGGDANVDQFGRTLAAERAANETYRSVASGSQTAERLADDAVNGDQGLIDDLSGRVIRGSRGGLAGMVMEGWGALRDVGRFGAGAAGNRAREDAAALLIQNDPTTLANAMREAVRQGTARKLAERSLLRATQTPAATLGFGTGAIIGANQ